ncbi:hypothetical protein HYS96_00495 [Candidatus Daviesbacteria bacterium]|nr:hypothetical protein [Candidatus Daviesbacteria bacterium]
MLGRVRAALDNNTIPVVGGEFDGKVVKFRQFAPFLPPYPYEPQSVEVEAARLNVRFPKVLDAMLFSGNRNLRNAAYIEAMGGEDFGNITKIAMQTALLEPQDPPTVIRVVNGGTNQLPLRALSGLLPALVYMEYLKEVGVAVPQLQMIFADHISAAANHHLDFERVTAESTKFAELARHYIEAFFPVLENHVLMLRDTQVGAGTVLGDELAEISSLVDQVISDQTRHALANKAYGNGTGVYYGSAHLLVHDIALPGAFAPILEGQPTMVDPKTIVSIGGRQERFFYRFRHGINPYLPARYREVLTFQFFTRHQVPPYYMASDGDVSMTDKLDPYKIGAAAKYDLDYLQKLSSIRGDLQQFLEDRI